MVAGRLRLPEEVVKEVFTLVRSQPEDTSNQASDRLTARKRVTLTLLANGRSYTEIGEARGISPVIVRNTLYRIQEILGVKNKQEFVMWAVRNGLLVDVAVGRESQGLPEG